MNEPREGRREQSMSRHESQDDATGEHKTRGTTTSDGGGAVPTSDEQPQHRGSNRRSDHELANRQRGRSMRSGYAEQGFGAGERRGSYWGGGRRGGYGGGEPGGMYAWHAGPWSAADERFERGRGPRAWGPDGWAIDAPWRAGELAGRGESGATQLDRDLWTPRERWNVPGPHSGRGPEGYRRSEAAIREDVCERLTRHGDLDASRISVHVEECEVILEGYVDNRAAKRMAEDTAESVSGVRDVHNRLRIAVD